jgi:hypothetical protein
VPDCVCPSLGEGLHTLTIGACRRGGDLVSQLTNPPTINAQIKNFNYNKVGWRIFVGVGASDLERVTVEIPQNFRSFVDGALLRLQAQYPSLRFLATATGIEVASFPAGEFDDLRKNILHAVYRERIYVETLPLRKALIGAVTAK